MRCNSLFCFLLFRCSVESVFAPSPSLRTQWICPVAMSSAEPAGRGRGLCLCIPFLRVSVNYSVFPLFFSFLNVKIQEGDAHNIFCPEYECYQLVPVHVIESVVSREMDQRYLQFDIKVKCATHC